MTKASFQAFCRNYTGTALEAMADAHALCDLQNAASGDIAARLGAISGLPPAVAVQVAWNGTDTDLDTYFNAGVAILRSLGSNAHVWLPGANGTTVASLPSNNYLLSDGSTGYSTVDGVDGLTLDGMGSLGSELVTNGSFATNDFTGWSVVAGTWSAATGAAVCTAGANSTISQTILAVGRTYQITLDVVSLTGTLVVYAGASQVSSFTTTGTKTVYLRCLGDTVFYVQFSGSGTGSVDNISVKEYTGTHLTQATTANKPLVRRGMLNLLTYSNDLTNAAWLDYRSCTVSGQAIVEAVATAEHFVQRATSVTIVSGVAYTAVYLVKANGRNFFAACNDAAFGVLGGVCRWDITTGVNTVTGSGCTVSSASAGSGWYLLTITATATGVAARPAVGPCLDGTTAPSSWQSYLGDGASGVLVAAVGVMAGSWTAAQILAEGGIPTTTATAASNTAAGKYWWSFDGSNDSMLSGNLGITSACTIVIAGVVNALSVAFLFTETANGVNLYYDASGTLIFAKDGVGQLVNKPAAIAAGVPFVITARLSGGTAVLRVNGVQVASAATALTFSATTGARIGTYFDGTSNPANCSLGWVVPIAAALSDADCLTVERLVSSQFPNGPVF